MGATELQAIVRFRFHDGDVEEFKRLSDQCMETVRAKDTGTLQYDTYFNDDKIDPLNKGLMTFASYNAGPGRIRQLRREAAARGLNPNVWFGNVEQIASERIGRETVTYVSNIYKYYIAYRLVLEQTSRRDATKQAMKAQVASR